MKRKMAILLSLAITIMLSQTEFGAVQNIKCISNPIEPKDFTIAYADSQYIVTYSNGVFTVDNGTSAKKYTIPGVKDWLTLKDLSYQSYDRYRFIRTYDKTSKLYNYSSLDILTGKQTFLIKSTINITYYKLTNNGRLLVASGEGKGLVANSTIGKSLDNLQLVSSIFLDPHYYWKNGNLYYIDFSTLKESIAIKKANQTGIKCRENSSNSNNPKSVFYQDGNTLRGFLPKGKIGIEITGIESSGYIGENDKQTKLAIVTKDNNIEVYNVKTRSIEKTIKVGSGDSDSVDDIYWNYDGNTPLLIASEGECQEKLYMEKYCYNLRLIANDNIIPVYKGIFGCVTVSKDSFRFEYGYAEPEDRKENEQYCIDAVCSIDNGKIIKMIPEKSSYSVLRKEKDFTIYNDNGSIGIKADSNYNIIRTDNNQYCFIYKPKTKGFYIYNIKGKKLYHSDYNITNALSFYVIGSDKYAIILASDKKGNNYLNKFALN